MLQTVEQIQAVIAGIPTDLIVPEHTDDGHYYRDMGVNEVYASVTTKGSIIEAEHLKKWAAKLAVEHIDKNWDIITPDNKREIYDAAIMAHQDIVNDAGGIGTEGHHVIERYLKDWMATRQRPADITKYIVGQDVRLWAITRSAEKFFIDFECIPVASELLVASRKYRYAGTLDSLMLVARTLDRGNGSCDNQPGMFGEKNKPHEYYGYANPLRWNDSVCRNCNKKITLEFTLVDFKTSNSINKVEYAMQVSAYWQALYEMTGLRPKNLFILQLDKEVKKPTVMRVVNRPECFRAFAHLGKVYDFLNNGKEKLSPLKLKERIPLSML